MRTSKKMKKILLALHKHASENIQEDIKKNREDPDLDVQRMERYWQWYGLNTHDLAKMLYGDDVMKDKKPKPRVRIRKQKFLPESYRVSLQQTMTVLEENNLVQKGKTDSGRVNESGLNKYSLTEEGRNKAEEIRDEIRSFIEEFHDLV